MLAYIGQVSITGRIIEDPPTYIKSHLSSKKYKQGCVWPSKNVFKEAEGHHIFSANYAGFFFLDE
jgi:Zn-dependent M32 family carboxypeptidase